MCYIVYIHLFQVTISLNEREVTPSSTVDMRIHTRPGSLVCVAAVDRSVSFLRPGYQLNIEKVISFYVSSKTGCHWSRYEI